MITLTLEFANLEDVSAAIAVLAALPAQASTPRLAVETTKKAAPVATLNAPIALPMATIATPTPAAVEAATDARDSVTVLTGVELEMGYEPLRDLVVSYAAKHGPVGRAELLAVAQRFGVENFKDVLPAQRRAAYAAIEALIQARGVV